MDKKTPISLDARGLNCPGPVLLVKDALEQEHLAHLTVLVDNQASSENVSRFLHTKGYTVTEQKKGSAYILSASDMPSQTTSQQQTASNSFSPSEEKKKTVILVSGTTLGHGDKTLGKKLMINYLKTIGELGEELWQIIFINSGVKLTINKSPILADLLKYQENGVTILACGTCLDHFGLMSQKEVGTTTNMLDIVSATQLADKVITVG